MAGTGGFDGDSSALRSVNGDSQGNAVRSATHQADALCKGFISHSLLSSKKVLYRLCNDLPSSPRTLLDSMAFLVPSPSNWTRLPQHSHPLPTLSRRILFTPRSSSPFLPPRQRHRLYSSRTLSRSPCYDHTLTIGGRRPCRAHLLRHHNILPPFLRSLSSSRLRFDERLREYSLATHNRTSKDLQECIKIQSRKLEQAKKKRTTRWQCHAPST